ncbi:hypothetical protein [Ktedonobacter racemifer]|uniref:Uncharacterized protein n=1 Tax=Ktedonobacter racemifer DSM 44963 TaxID=485913 RepID=D6TCK2_KTERA|nr:hypothetical protein [Ktedonobacter racemifer]EFH90019.1 hypothetical protein Krac_11615 [Ktedonobacter racemifer DSM 44963]
MIELKHLAVHAAQHRIKGRSYKRNSLLKPLDFILDALDRCPDTTNENEIEFAKASSKGQIYDHVKRVSQGVHEEDIYKFVDLFFEEVLANAHGGNVNKLLQRERAIRSAYLVYMREALAAIFVARGKAKTADAALQSIDQDAIDENDLDEESA